jgi:hypothetical protein
LHGHAFIERLRLASACADEFAQRDQCGVRVGHQGFVVELVDRNPQCLFPMLHQRVVAFHVSRHVAEVVGKRHVGVREILAPKR